MNTTIIVMFSIWILIECFVIGYNIKHRKEDIELKEREIQSNNNLTAAYKEYIHLLEKEYEDVE